MVNVIRAHSGALAQLLIALAILAVALVLFGAEGALLAAAPIVVRNPSMTLAELVAGVPSVTPVEVSDDVSSVELDPDVPTTDTTVFSGTYQEAGDVSWGCTVTIVVNADTYANWEPLVGKEVRVKLFDKGADTTRYRQFDSEVIFNPGLGGGTEPGQARSFDMVMPVRSDVTYVEP